MTLLQKVVLGTPPDAKDGDTNRDANVKANSNVDVLNAQATLTSAATLVVSPQALTAALHVGKRVNVNLGAPGAVSPPPASTCSADSVILLRNVGTTVVTVPPAAGSGDAVSISKLNPGETALIDTDGVHAWTVLMRGRTNSDNEVVNGNCAVNGNETVGGTLAVAGLTTLSSDTTRTGAAGSNRGAFFNTGVNARWYTFANSTAEGGSNAGSDYSINAYADNGTYLSTPLVIARATGAAAFSQRPTFAGSVPWDAANLAQPMTLNTAQTVSGPKTYTGLLQVTSGFSGTATSNSAVLYGTGGIASLAFVVGNNSGAGSLWFNQSTSGFAFINYNNSAYAPVTCSTLTQASDVRFKTDVETITGALEKIRSIRGVRYSMDGKRQVGVIAQEVQAVFPEVITELYHGYDGPPAPNAKPFLGVNYPSMVGPLLQALIELDKIVEKQAARLDALEAK